MDPNQGGTSDPNAPQPQMPADQPAAAPAGDMPTGEVPQDPTQVPTSTPAAPTTEQPAPMGAPEPAPVEQQPISNPAPMEGGNPTDGDQTGGNQGMDGM